MFSKIEHTIECNTQYFDFGVVKYGGLYAAELTAGNRSQDPGTLYTDCEKRDALLLLIILGGIETNPGPTPCAICHRSNWNQYGVWSGRGKWVHMSCTNLQSIEQWINKFDCKLCSWCKTIEANTRQSFRTHDNTHLNIPQLNCLKQKLDNIIDWMQKNKIQIAAIQETKLNEKSTLKSPPGKL